LCFFPNRSTLVIAFLLLEPMLQFPIPGAPTGCAQPGHDCDRLRQSSCCRILSLRFRHVSSLLGAPRPQKGRDAPAWPNASRLHRTRLPLAQDYSPPDEAPGLPAGCVDPVVVLEPFVPWFMFDISFTSTRRFFARPAAVLLSAAGSSLPMPIR